MAEPIRVLHAVHRMDRGGIETWLMNVLRAVDRSRFHFDFLVYTTQACAYDDEIRSLGSQIIPCIPATQPIAHLRDLERILRTQGPFDVVHVHGTAADSAVLRVAARAGVPVRIIHAHNAGESRRRLRSYGYRLVTRHWMRRYMTHGFGCSEAANTHEFGAHWPTDERYQVLYYGMNWEAFREPVDVQTLRNDLGLPLGALVIGHVGRFHPQKNHSFWLEIAKQIAALRDDAYFLLVGDGELKQGFQDLVCQCGLQQRFIFTGERPDVYRLLQAMDVFLFPSHFEGLGIVVIEAQTVGLPCVVSEAVPREATVTERQVRRVPLGAPPEAWARVVLKMAGQKRQQNHQASWNTVAHSHFSLGDCLDRLSEVYGQARERAEDRHAHPIR